MRPSHRRAFLIGCFVITAFAGPRSAVNLWNGLRGPYVDAPATEVAAEMAAQPIQEEIEAR